jgi:hypothetical protein
MELGSNMLARYFADAIYIVDYLKCSFLQYSFVISSELTNIYFV